MKKELFDELVSNAEQAIAYLQGKPVKGIRITRIAVPEDVDVKAVRARLKMTQETFAFTFGFSLSGLKKWELGERKPEGAARVLLHMIEKDPVKVLELAS